MMFDFETLMDDIFLFTNHEPSAALIDEIKNTAKNQRSYKSKHKYDLSKFGPVSYTHLTLPTKRIV